VRNTSARDDAGVVGSGNGRLTELSLPDDRVRRVLLRPTRSCGYRSTCSGKTKPLDRRLSVFFQLSG